ncbi:hypothetical protein [Henriciella pelagia]|uniref:hypothetical protein n=1 Tax=Henriciella pelagia TaxID=1977912 RepID=UPI00351710AF
MTKVRPQYIAFNQGELDSDALVRVDLETYHRGAEIMENILPLVQGGMEKVPGTQFIGEITNVGTLLDADGGSILDANGDSIESAAASLGILRPFVFSEVDRLVLEITEGQIRFISGTGYVQVTAPSISLGGWTDESAAPSTGGGAAPGGGTGDLYSPEDFSLGDVSWVYA